MDINEKALLYRAQSGDRQAAGKLYEGYYQDLYSYIFYKVSHQETAEQLTAEVFVRMLQELPGYLDQGKPFIYWLYKIASDLVDAHNSNGKPSSGENGKYHSEQEEGPPLPIEQESAAVDCFRRAVRHLDDIQQSLIIHRFVEGRSVADVAELIDRSERSVRSLQNRALRSLEKALYQENCL